MTNEKIIFGFDQTKWPISKKEVRIQALTENILDKGRCINQEKNIHIIPLTNLTLPALAGLTIIEANAFQAKMGQSFVEAWNKKEDRILFFSLDTENTPQGFILLNPALSKQNIIYVEMTAILNNSQHKGISSQLRESCFRFLNDSFQSPVIIGRSRHPHILLSYSSVFKKLGKESFPINRKPSKKEQQAIQQLLKEKIIANLRPGESHVEIKKSIMHQAYPDFLPFSTDFGDKFQTFLEREEINFQSFIKNGDAFFVGGTL